MTLVVDLLSSSEDDREGIVQPRSKRGTSRDGLAAQEVIEIGSTSTDSSSGTRTPSPAAPPTAADEESREAQQPVLGTFWEPSTELNKQTAPKNVFMEPFQRSNNLLKLTIKVSSQPEVRQPPTEDQIRDDESKMAHSRSTSQPLASPRAVKLALKSLEQRPVKKHSMASVTSFFCKAKPQQIISQIERTVLNNEVPKHPEPKSDSASAEIASPPKKTRKVETDPLKVVSDSGILDYDVIKVAPQKPALPIPASLTAPLPTMLPRESPVAPRVKTEPAATCPTPARQATALLGLDVDPALAAAFSARSRNQTKDELNESSSPTKAALKSFVAKVYEVSSLTHAQDPSKRPTMSFTCNDSTTFQQLKQSYCSKTYLSPMQYVLTFRDTRLFDCVKVTAAGIPTKLDTAGKHYMEFVLWEQGILRQAKEGAKKEKRDLLEMLQQPSAGPVDVSDILSGNLGTNSSASGTMSISIKAGQSAAAEDYPVTPSTTFLELLQAYAARHPEADVAKARFYFDGGALRQIQTIADVGLEDEDMLELRL